MDDDQLLRALVDELRAIVDRHPPCAVTTEIMEVIANDAERRLEALRASVAMGEGLALHRALCGPGRPPVTA